MTAQPDIEEPVSLLDGVITAADLDGMTFPPLVEHVPTLIPEGFGVLAGPPKIGKSWLVSSLALSCAQGGSALGGINVNARCVLLLSLEDGYRRLQDRMRRLNFNLPLPPTLDIKTVCAPGTVLYTIAEWLELHSDDPEPPLVILDTIGRARPQRRAGDDPYIADYQLGARIKACIDMVSGAALLAVHHTRKSRSDDWVETISGTNGITGSADYVLALNRKRQTTEGVISVTGRDVAEAEFALTIDEGRWKLDGSTLDEAAYTAAIRAATARLSDVMVDILTVVREAESAVSPAEVAQKLGISNKVASVYLTRLDQRGDVIKEGRGQYVSRNTVESVESVESLDSPEGDYNAFNSYEPSSDDEDPSSISDYNTFNTFNTSQDEPLF